MGTERVTERQVTTELEHGDASHVPALFSGKFQEERMASLRTMQELYQGDVQTGRAKPGLEFKSQAYYNPDISIVQDGNWLYTDTLDLYKMAHRRPDDNVPPDRKPIDKAELRKVTTDLENGNPESLKTALDGKFMEERARYLKAVEEVNQHDLAEHNTGVSLSMTLSGHKWFGNQMSVQRYAPGGILSSNFWGNPHVEYSETLNMANGTRAFNLQLDPRH